MKKFKDYITEAETPTTSIHQDVKALGNVYYEGGGSSVATSYFRGDKNDHFDKVHKMVLSKGYKLVSPSSKHNGGTSVYHKDLEGGKRTAKIEISHYPGEKHVYSVNSITNHNHY